MSNFNQIAGKIFKIRAKFENLLKINDESFDYVIIYMPKPPPLAPLFIISVLMQLKKASW